MARLLRDSHTDAQAQLDRSVSEATRVEEEVEPVRAARLPLDGAALRGIPAISRNSNPGAITGTQPGHGPLFDDD